MSTPKPLKLPAILFAAAQIFCACSKETPPPIYDAPLFESQADFKEKRTLDFVCAKNFSAVGAAVGFSETKNVARLFFTDLQRAFTEVDFFADGKKRKIVSRESADANSARFSLENGGTLSFTMKTSVGASDRAFNAKKDKKVVVPTQTVDLADVLGMNPLVILPNE